MKKITKKLCSTVCALLAFSGNRGGALTKEALHLTKEILCNAGQWFACLPGWFEYYFTFNFENKQGKWVPEKSLTPGQKAFGYAFGATTVGNVVDAAKRSYDIAHDVIKGSKSKPDTTNKKESKNYWPILEAIFGAVQLTFTFGHRPILDPKCKNRGAVCTGGLITFIVGTTSLADAYFRFRENNQNSGSPIQKKEEATQPNQTLSNPENSKDSSSDKK